jgi:hypothetical protein
MDIYYVTDIYNWYIYNIYYNRYYVTHLFLRLIWDIYNWYIYIYTIYNHIIYKTHIIYNTCIANNQQQNIKTIVSRPPAPWWMPWLSELKHAVAAIDLKGPWGLWVSPCFGTFKLPWKRGNNKGKCDEKTITVRCDKTIYWAILSYPSWWVNDLDPYGNEFVPRCLVCKHWVLLCSTKSCLSYRDCSVTIAGEKYTKK